MADADDSAAKRRRLIESLKAKANAAIELPTRNVISSSSSEEEPTSLPKFIPKSQRVEAKPEVVSEPKKKPTTVVAAGESASEDERVVSASAEFWFAPLPARTRQVSEVDEWAVKAHREREIRRLTVMK